MTYNKLIFYIFKIFTVFISLFETSSSSSSLMVTKDSIEMNYKRQSITINFIYSIKDFFALLKNNSDKFMTFIFFIDNEIEVNSTDVKFDSNNFTNVLSRIEN